VEAILALVTTNSPPPAKPPELFKAPRGPLIIESDGPADFSLNGHWVNYRDNVRATDSQMKLTCEWLEANLPLQSSERFTNIVARTNVVIDFTDNNGQKSRGTGDKAVYFYHVDNGVTNETVTLYGNPPKLQRGQSIMTADTIIWDRITGDVRTTGNFRGYFVQDTNAPAITNSMPLGTNELAMPANTPAPGTNQTPAPKSP
jgi:lipopolysaccharide export system protein LptA